jgi:alcohol dehydrogenase
MSLHENKHIPKIHFGPGAIFTVDSEVLRIGAKRVLIVTDSGIMHVGHPGNLRLHLEELGCKVEIFDQVVENPTTETVADCVEVARRFDADLLIGLGGGSSLDTAKGCNFILTNGGQMQDYWGYGKASKPMLPLIAIPTTAGTGSECQSYALISDAGTHMKMACGDPKALPAVSILDPELTLTQPPFVAACTGIDALSHAIESAVTLRRTPFSSIYSRESFRLLQENLETVFDEPANLVARGQVLLGAAYAGIAIENSMLGCAHSAANPLTAHYGTVHGNAVGLTLPHAMSYNSKDQEALTIYARLALESRLINRDASEQDAFEALHTRVLELLKKVKFPLTLRELKVAESDIPTLAKEAAAQWTAQFNPRPITEENFVQFYQNAY